jgi:DivIVA domain-containing protein
VPVLTPEDITSRSFLVSLRGYDRDEVDSFLQQVADEVEALRTRVEQLESAPQTAASSPPAATPVADETATAAPSTADASDMFAQIGRETQRILEAAQSAGEELRRAAQEETEELRRSVEAEVEQLRRSAQAEVEQLRSTAEEETAELRRLATEETDELRRVTQLETSREVKQARRDAARIIADGERQREAIDAVVAELLRARHSLAEELRELGRSVERTLRDLTADDERTSTVREALGESARADAEAGTAAPAAPAAEEPAADGAAAHEPAAEGPAAADAATSSRVEEIITDAVTTDAADPARSAGAADAVEPASEADAPAAAVRLEETVELDVEPDAPDAPDSAAEDGEPLDAQAQALRADALAPLHPKVVRKLKRGLQDIQNGLLDRLRRTDGKGEAADYLPDPVAIATLAQLTEEFLAAAHRAGVGNGEILAGEEVDVATPAQGLSADLVEGLGALLVTDLEVALGQGLEAGEDGVAIGERVGRVFSDAKEAPVEERSALALLRAYEHGLLDAWRASSLTRRRWALAAEPPCPEPRCRDNDRAGALPFDAVFPSGDAVPPARIGCNCTTVPDRSTSESAT